MKPTTGYPVSLKLRSHKGPLPFLYPCSVLLPTIASLRNSVWTEPISEGLLTCKGAVTVSATPIGIEDLVYVKTRVPQVYER